MNRKTVLFVSVGGSPEPITRAYAGTRPDRVVFICTESSRAQVTGNGMPCEIRRGGSVLKSLPNLVTQMQLDNFEPEQDMVVLPNPDDLGSLYREICEAMQRTRAQTPNDCDLELVVDYTGGTKTMSAAMVLAAVDHAARLSVVTGPRRDLTRVEGNSITTRVAVGEVVAQRVFDQFTNVRLARFDYDGLAEDIERAFREELPSHRHRELFRLRDLCQAFGAWDRFDHREALDTLDNYMGDDKVRDYALYLKKIIASRAALDEHFSDAGAIRGHGYEVVEDLLLNAERRMIQQRYDDAVGRLYRALELTAQIRLSRAHDLQTAAIPAAAVPEPLRAEFSSRGPSGADTFRLALLDSYRLLAASEDLVGTMFQARERPIMNALEIRNYSLFAHGFSPVTRERYAEFDAVIGAFISEVIQAVNSSKRGKKSRLNVSLMQLPTFLSSGS